MEYLIGDFSKISRLGIKTLRYYHEISLLKPSRVDPISGYRYYDENCLIQVQAITRLKELNFSLVEIREILSGKTEDQSLLQIMQQKLTEVTRQITTLEQIRERLTGFVRSESVPLIRPGAVVEKQVPDLLIASIRFQGCYSDLDAKIIQLLKICGAAAVGPPFSLYYDDHPMEMDADIEICVAVNTQLETSEVHSRVLSGGRTLSILHPGFYNQIWISYQVVVDYWHRHQLEPVFPSREIYLKGGTSSSENNPQYLTEIQFLVK
jgi:DNA-binding transcriptional MerR regulator